MSLTTYLLPGESHPLKSLLAIIRTVGADEFKEVVSFQVTGLLAMELSCSTSTVRLDVTTNHTIVEPVKSCVMIGCLT